MNADPVSTAPRPPSSFDSSCVSFPRGAALVAVFLGLAALSACGDEETDPFEGRLTLDEACDIDNDFAGTGGVPRDGIPALSDPEMVPATSSTGLDYLEPESRVVGFMVGSQAYAVPHNILWHHEIVNLAVGDQLLAVTYCPLTGSPMVFDRSGVDGAELGVSGLIYFNNLIMFPRGSEIDLIPQMMAGNECLERIDLQLSQWPAVEMRWDAWQERHPNSLVVSENTGRPDFSYTENSYPYGNYEVLDAPFLFPMPTLDSRRPPKERVLGAPPSPDDPGIALPFRALEQLSGEHAVVEIEYEGAPAVALWSDGPRGGMIYRPRTRGGETVTLEADAQGFVDAETGSRWSLSGTALSGELGGRELVPVERAFVAFWGAWSAYYPDTRLWTQ